MFGKQPITARASTVIKKPVAEVFQFIGAEFFANYPRWSPEVVELQALSEGPLKLGAMARQVRVDHGHRTESTFAVSEFQPNRRIAFSGVSNAYRCAYEFDAIQVGGATRVAFSFELPTLELYMRPFEKLIREVAQESAERTLRNLKSLLEDPRPGSTVTAP